MLDVTTTATNKKQQFILLKNTPSCQLHAWYITIRWMGGDERLEVMPTYGGLATVHRPSPLLTNLPSAPLVQGCGTPSRVGGPPHSWVRTCVRDYSKGLSQETCIASSERGNLRAGGFGSKAMVCLEEDNKEGAI
jgi:hypothetical protein